MKNNMREGWEYKKLGEVCHVTMGQSPDGLSINEFDGVEFHQGKTYFGDRFLGESNQYTTSPTKLAEANSVLLCVRAPVGIPNITKRVICIGRGLCSLSSTSELDNYFLFYALLGKQDYFEKNATGSTFKAISSKVVSNTIIPLPPLPLQQSIVAELDEINNLLSLKRKELETYDKLAQSIFYEMFGDPVENEKGWEVKKLGEVCMSKLKYGSGASAIEYNGHTRYVRITDINADGTLNEEARSPSVIEDEYVLNAGDIVFARSGATVGKTYLHKERKVKCLYAGYLIKASLNKNIVHPEYIFIYTQSKQYKDWVELNARTVAQPNINAKQYSDLPIPLPPLPLQQLFATRIEAIEVQKVQVKAAIEKLERLLAARMQYWFD